MRLRTGRVLAACLIGAGSAVWGLAGGLPGTVPTALAASSKCEPLTAASSGSSASPSASQAELCVSVQASLGTKLVTDYLTPRRSGDAKASSKKPAHGKDSNGGTGTRLGLFRRGRRQAGPGSQPAAVQRDTVKLPENPA